MKEIIKIAWRNLWRNKRRTMITVSSIFFALFYAIIMNSFQLGTYNLMINNTVTQYSGHLQIQDKEYMDNPIIDYSIPYTNSIKKVLDDNEKVDYYFPRLQSGALASSGPTSKISMVMGVDYQTEVDLIGLDKRVVRYYLDSLIVNDLIMEMDEENAAVLLKYNERLFNSKEDIREELYAGGLDTAKYIQEIYEKTKLPEVKFNKFGDEVLVGYKLAQYLELNQGDSIILIGQGFRGTTAVGKYKIAGFLQFPLDDFNRMAVYMPLHTAQMFISAYELDENLDTTFYVNYIAINTTYQASIRQQDYDRILKVKNEIESGLEDKMLTVVGWRNLNKKMIETIEVGQGKTFIFVFILYLVIGFGVLGTVMMLLNERKREFGVMLALGMKRRILALIISFELIFIGLIAIISGIAVTTPILWLASENPFRLRGDMAVALAKMNMEPVLKFQPMGTFVFDQVAVIAFIVGFVLVYALMKIRKLKVISSMRA